MTPVSPAPRNRLWIVAVLAAAMLAAIASYIAWRFIRNDAWIAPESAKVMPNPIPPSAAGLAMAKSLYTDNCARCHGDAGAGDGPDASSYRPAPASLADAQRMNGITDGELFWKIAQGRRPMPSFEKQLSLEQRWQLVNYIRSLAEPQP